MKKQWLSDSVQQKKISQILKKPSNRHCADCSSISPTWVSLDFGVFICSNCAGGHRALGPTITRVKSTKLDSWLEEWLQNTQIGNLQLNEFWEAKLTVSVKKPKLGSSIEEVCRYVYEKYVKRKFAAHGVDPLKKMKQQKCQNHQIKIKNPQDNIIIKPQIKIDDKPINNLLFEQPDKGLSTKSEANSDIIHFSDQQFSSYKAAAEVNQGQQLTYSDLVKLQQKSTHQSNSNNHLNQFNFPNQALPYHPHFNYHNINNHANRNLYHSLNHQLPFPYIGNNNFQNQNLVGVNINTANCSPHIGPITLQTFSHDNHKINKEQQSWVNSWK